MSLLTLSKLLECLPNKLRGALYSKKLRFSFEPIVDVPLEGVTKSTVVFCFDFELAWAWRFVEAGIESSIIKARIEREQILKIIALLEKYKIAATWAMTGVLAEEDPFSCLAREPPPHLAAYESKNWVFPGGDPVSGLIPKESLKGPEWQGGDLLEKIISSKMTHEIAAHSFLHHDCSHQVYSQDFFEWELRALGATLKKYDIEPSSFIYPANLVGHVHILEKFKYNMTRYYPRMPEAQIATPKKITENLMGLHESLCLEAYGYDSIYMGIKSQDLLYKALSWPGVVSFWLHPSLDDFDFRNIFEPIIAKCADLREQDKIDILTMNQLFTQMERSGVLAK